MANERKSRRADDSGASKLAARKPAATSHRRGGMFDFDPETQARLLIFGAVALVIAIAGGFLIFGYWYSVVKPRNRTVLQVADHKVSYAAMKRRMAYEFLQNTNYQSQQGVQILPEAAFQALANELTETTQAGPKFGITIDAAESDNKLREKIGVVVDADQREFADSLRAALDRTGLTDSEYRAIADAEIYEQKIRDKFKNDAPATSPHVKVGVITTGSEADAQAAIARVNAGEDFSEVAKAVSKETDVATTGGVKAYINEDSLAAPYKDFAFSAAIGAVSAPIPVGSAQTAAPGTFYVAKLIDRSDQPTTDAEKTHLANTQLDAWIVSTQDELKANGQFKRDWEPQAQADAWLAIGGDVTAKLADIKKQADESQKQADDLRATTIAQLTASPQVPNTPSPSTPGPETTPAAAATSADSGQNSTPVAPAAPVAPGSNGQ